MTVNSPFQCIQFYLITPLPFSLSAHTQMHVVCVYISIQVSMCGSLKLMSVSSLITLLHLVNIVEHGAHHFG